MPSIHQFTLAKVCLRAPINKKPELVYINMSPVHLWCVSKVFCNQFLFLDTNILNWFPSHPGFNNPAPECSITTRDVV